MHPPAAITEVARILNRPGQSFADVLVIGGHYIHCGQPMTSAGGEVRVIRATSPSLAVYLSTQVLHCPCGFQVEVPDQDSAYPAGISHP